MASGWASPAWRALDHREVVLQTALEPSKLQLVDAGARDLGAETLNLKP